MIKRIVKLEIRKEEVNTFKNLFLGSKHIILSFDGCYHVECLEAIEPEGTFFTYSRWESVAALDNYRHSEAFAKIWTNTKELFGDRASAWSTHEVEKKSEQSLMS